MRKTIWIIDDNADSRLLARAILSPEYDVVELESGQHAIDRVASEHPDLVLLDLSMPGVSGFDVLAVIRMRPELDDVPVIAFTARASEAERKGIMAFGFDGCVVKPVIDENLLMRPVAQMLSTRQNRLSKFA